MQIRNFLLLSTALVVSSVSSQSARAAITGKVGVGTWGNTQAEFADVKVTQGSTTLYQSNFSSGAATWTPLSGTWATQNGYLRQTGNAAPALNLVGNTSWSNYTLTLKARKISGAEGFFIVFGSPGDSTQSWWNIGGWNNTKSAVQAPGLPLIEKLGGVQTNVWYTIKVELSDNDVRCYLDGTRVYDATRMLDSSERTTRFNQLINSGGFSLLSTIEQDALRNIAGRNVYIGEAARATFRDVPGSQNFANLSAAQQALAIRQVNKNRMTWNRGYGYGNNAGRDNTITYSMDTAVSLFNSLGVFDKHLTANNETGTPTADANYDGWMRFGGQMSYPTAIHEIEHSLGGGTHWRWPNLMNNGWQGQYGNIQISEFDGAGSRIWGDRMHFWPYGLNQDSEYTPENARRSVLLMGAMRRDMLIADQVNFGGNTSVASGTYTLVPRHASNVALTVLNSNTANGAPLGISTLTGASNQKFLIDLQTEGTYRIRTSLSGNRSVELPSGTTDNGTRVQLWDTYNLPAQRWFLIPTDSGYFKIAPLNNLFRSIDVAAGSTTDGGAVQSWDFFDSAWQQWKLTPVTQTNSTKLAPAKKPSSVFALAPRAAQRKAL